MLSRRMRSTQRLESSTLPPTVTRRVRWVETTYEEACSTGPCATPLASWCDVRPDTVQRTRSARALPEDRTRLEELNRPPESITAPRPTRHSPGRAARRCCHLFAVSATNRSPTHPAPEIAHDAGDPKATIARRNPRLGADAQWPPCGDPPTPELTRSPGHQHPTEQVARG
jgi:hypothetical protein